jgi:hypothetical protein
MFEVDRATGHRPLATTTLALLEEQGLMVRRRCGARGAA